MKLKDDPEKCLKGYSTPCRKPSNESVCNVRTRATNQVRRAVNQVRRPVCTYSVCTSRIWWLHPSCMSRDVL